MRVSFVPLAAALLAAVPLPRTPATIVITGHIVDAAGGQPVGGAVVLVASTAFRAQSDAQGGYRLTLPRDAYRGRRVELIVRAIGYRPQTLGVSLAGDTAVVADVRLAREPAILDEVVAAGQAREKDREGRRVDAAATIGRTEAAKAAAPQMALRGMSSQASADPGFDRRRPPGVPFNTEEYKPLGENEFLAVSGNPRSTFSIDVDRASYSNVRRFLRSGVRPPRDAVRIEELLNYFTYDYPDADGTVPFSITTEVASAPWRPAHRLVRIGLQAKRLDFSALPPNNLVFLVDVSGSMNSDDKLPLLKSSLRLLVAELRPQDRVAMVVYAGNAGLVLPSTPGDQKRTILDAIDRLEAGGSTNGGAGIQLAYQVAKDHFLSEGNNRVILATDGDFNVGVASDGELERLITKRRDDGTYLTVLGFGTGNYADARMETLADKGNGNFAYIDDILEAKKALVHEIGGTLYTLAKDVKLQVEFNPARVKAYRLIGYENRLLADEDFKDDKKDAGELGAGHSVTALYEVIPTGAETDVTIRDRDPLRYQNEAAPTRTTGTDELMYVKLRYKAPTGGSSREVQHVVRPALREPSADFRFTMAVAGFGMLLRESDHKGALTWGDVARWAEAGRGRDAEGYRAEFLQLVRAAEALPISPLAAQ